MDSIRAHYAAKLAEHGHTAEGVGWRDTRSQVDRFRALRLLFVNDFDYTVNDWGCGYGEFRNWIDPKQYTGYDIVPQEGLGDEFVLSDKPTKIADYTVASGLFNVMDRPREEWCDYVCGCIFLMDAMSRKGYGFNFLHDRADRKEEGLFYTYPAWVLTCTPARSRVSILEYYSPWDFTILVNKC